MLHLANWKIFLKFPIPDCLQSHFETVKDIGFNKLSMSLEGTEDSQKKKKCQFQN